MADRKPKKPRRRPGQRCDASETVPVVIETPNGPILVYRFSRGKVGIMHPPECRVVKSGKEVRGK
jgi:hypothetical protein